MNNKLLRLSPKIELAGMFAVLNYFVDYLFVNSQKDSNTRFEIVLDDYCMYQNQRGSDVFLNYFQPIVTARLIDPDVVYLPDSGKKTIARRGLMTRVGRENARELLPPLEKDREALSAVIHQYFKLNERMVRIVDDFRKLHFEDRKVIGLHLRGAGRTDGGTGEYRHQFELEDGIPYAPYFDKIDTYIAEHPSAKVFVCSDSKRVIERVRKQYGSRLLSYGADVTDFGEGHIATKRAIENGDQNTIDPSKMGEDVIAEAWLLSGTDYFVHGNSNISNFIISLNPHLSHVDIFEESYSYHLKGGRWMFAKTRSMCFFGYSIVRRLIGRFLPKYGCPE